ncbi:MAG: DivIVA family protein [Thermoleophilia bacterium]|nr:DivIVA family protein [Thermoleophilia bacterium]
MTLSPFEAERREFGSAPLGYRKRDVDNFVDEVQRSLRELWQERGDTREENERLKERLAQFEQMEDQLKATLMLAQDSAEKAHEQARRESELMMREAGHKSRDIVHGAHEEKQRLEMVLRDLHSAEQEARQRLRAMSGAILSHLDDTETLVTESAGNFRAIVQAYPEATELQASSESRQMPAVVASTEPETITVEEAGDEPQADRIVLDAELASIATERIDATIEHTRPAEPSERVSLGTPVATGETADAFFDAPPTFDASVKAERRERDASFADF